MPDFLRDGTGSGHLAKVDSSNRVRAHAISVPEEWDANDHGNAYNINTGVITLTDAADTPVLYLKNTGTMGIHISALAVGFGPSTGGSGGIPKITVIRNPTTGTIISTTPTNVDINSNRNYGSFNSLGADVYKGATGDTMTDGTDHIIFFQTPSGRLFAGIDEVIPTGASIGVKIDPQASNTAMDIYVAFICHLNENGD